MLEALMLLCLGAVAYNYAGYPVVLFVLATLSQAKSDLLYLAGRHNRRPIARAQYWPRVAMLVAAYNEEAVIAAKVSNCFELDYPADKLEFLFGLDAPSDKTPKVLSSMACSRLKVHQFRSRRGKLAVLGDLARLTSADILVLSDANTMVDRAAIRNLVRHFADPQVGAVSGEENRVDASEKAEAAETIYWRYESAIRILESRLRSSLGANGAVYAVRRSLFSIPERAIIEDFQIPLQVGRQGFRVIYDPEAVATEDAAPSQSAQFVRRVRIGAGDYQALFSNLSSLNPARGLPAFCYVSHKVLRWLAPFFLLFGLACSVPLALRSEAVPLDVAQWTFYLMAVAAYLLKRHGKKAPVASLALHFVMMNAALLMGCVAYLRGKQSLAWQATPRQNATRGPLRDAAPDIASAMAEGVPAARAA